MDKLDKISAGAIAVLVIWAMALVVYQFNIENEQSASLNKRREAIRIIDPNLEKKIDLVKNLIASNSIEKASLLADELIGAYPFEGTPFMLKGDIFLRKQLPIDAMLEYRKAIDLNPDFLDKNTPVFQGKKIKKTVEEAFVVIEEGLNVEPDSTKFKEDKKAMYYMLRKIAGSCS